jgi:UDP:flavonoid glycosyltransferase YjiC (YdhE family)
VYLHKPICSVPIANQIEQFINAAYVQKYKFGRQFNEFTADNIKSFLYDLTSFENNLSNYKQNGNQLLFDAIENWISKNIL